MLMLAKMLPVCPPDPSGDWRIHLWQAVSVAVWAGMLLLLLWLITRTRTWPWWLTVATIWLTTILAIDVPLFTVQRYVEHHPIGRVANFASGSWALTWGANLVLPAFFAVCALIWRRFPEQTDLTKNTIRARRAWFSVSLAAGVAAAMQFHHHDASRYNVYQFNSLSKILFDWGIYWSITTLLLYLLGVVLLSRRGGRLRWVAVALFLVEALILWHEAKFALPPDAYHGSVDPRRWFRACVALLAPMAG